MSDSPPPSGQVTGIIDRVLHFMDRPWKAVVVIFLVIICGVGWVIYEKRDTLLEAWLTPDTPELRAAEIPEDLIKLTHETSADLVQIWAVDLNTNSQRFLGALRHNGEKAFIPQPRRLPIIDSASDIRRLVNILEGRPVCVDVLLTGTPVTRRLAERGMKRACAIPIPPNPERFVGVIYLAWTEPTDVSNENVAVGAAREIAKRLATH